MCCSHVVTVTARVPTQVHSHVMCITWFITVYIFWCRNVPFFFGNVLSEYNPAFEFYNYFVHCQMFWGVIEFSISLVECVKDCLYFPWLVIFLVLVGSLSVCNGLVLSSLFGDHGRKSERAADPLRMFVCLNHSCSNATTMCETLYGFIFWRTFVGLGYYLILALPWKTADTGISSSSSPAPSIIFVIATACWTLPWSVTKMALYSYALINLIP
jgi:hypothetical protein